jgi:hypothetical protein
MRTAREFEQIWRKDLLETRIAGGEEICCIEQGKEKKSWRCTSEGHTWPRSLGTFSSHFLGAYVDTFIVAYILYTIICLRSLPSIPKGSSDGWLNRMIIQYYRWNLFTIPEEASCVTCKLCLWQRCDGITNAVSFGSSFPIQIHQDPTTSKFSHVNWTVYIQRDSVSLCMSSFYPTGLS